MNFHPSFVALARPASVRDCFVLELARMDLNPRQRQRLARAMRNSEAVLGDLGAVAPEVGAVKARARTAPHAQFGLSKSYWLKIVKDVCLVVRRRCPAPDAPIRETTPSPAWRARLAKIANGHEREFVAGFARWSTREGLEPEDVRDELVDRYVAARRAENGRAGWLLAQSLARSWNRLVEAVPCWPPIRLTRPTIPSIRSRRARRCAPARSTESR